MIADAQVSAPGWKTGLTPAIDRRYPSVLNGLFCVVCPAPSVLHFNRKSPPGAYGTALSSITCSLATRPPSKRLSNGARRRSQRMPSPWPPSAVPRPAPRTGADAGAGVAATAAVVAATRWLTNRWSCRSPPRSRCWHGPHFVGCWRWIPRRWRSQPPWPGMSAALQGGQAPRATPSRLQVWGMGGAATAGPMVWALVAAAVERVLAAARRAPGWLARPTGTATLAGGMAATAAAATAAATGTGTGAALGGVGRASKPPSTGWSRASAPSPDCSSCPKSMCSWGWSPAHPLGWTTRLLVHGWCGRMTGPMGRTGGVGGSGRTAATGRTPGAWGPNGGRWTGLVGVGGERPRHLRRTSFGRARRSSKTAYGRLRVALRCFLSLSGFMTPCFAVNCTLVCKTCVQSVFCYQSPGEVEFASAMLLP